MTGLYRHANGRELIARTVHAARFRNWNTPTDLWH